MSIKSFKQTVRFTGFLAMIIAMTFIMPATETIHVSPATPLRNFSPGISGNNPAVWAAEGDRTPTPTPVGTPTPTPAGTPILTSTPTPGPGGI